ncbi:TNF receptor-associated factor 5 [Diretmus argenteus]
MKLGGSEEPSRRSEEPSRRSEESSRRSEESSRRSEESSRRSEEPSRRSEESSRRSEEPSRRSEESSGRSEEPSRRSEESSRRSEESSRRSEEPSRRSEESSRRSEESSRRSEESSRRSGPVGSWESELASIQHSLKFVVKLKEEFVCPICGGVVLNPQQSSCGHIYCFHCLEAILSSLSSPVCPVDGAVITPAEVFQDKCCKREISGLEVYCTNSPACPSVTTLHRLQEHLKSCQYEVLQCSNPGCREALQRRYRQEHMTNTCPYRLEPCPHCQQPHRLNLIKEHEQSSCPEMKVGCPNRCSLKVPRFMLTEHNHLCPEVHIDCFYKKYGCSVQDKRAKVKLHEDAAVNQHMVLVLRSNTKLEKQMEALQEEVLLKQQEIQEECFLVDGLENEVRPLVQQSSRHEQMVSTAQRALTRQKDLLSQVCLEVQEVSRGFGHGVEDLDQLRSSLEAVVQQVSAAEALRDHLGTLEETFKRQSGLLDLHAAQISHNKEHLKELEATSYDGRLIWKIQDFSKRKEAEVKGQHACLSSVPFHTSCCGYRMAAKAYLNGDGEGRGSHLSLYIVLMPGEFDPLLPWPFRQTVSLSVLDQGGTANHRTFSFRPDPASNSFQRPASELISNVASGFSRFIPFTQLETPQNAVYVKDDTLFVKVKVDMAGLEDL